MRSHDGFSQGDGRMSEPLMKANTLSVLMDLEICTHFLDAVGFWDTGTAVVSLDDLISDDEELVGVDGCLVSVEGLRHHYQNTNSPRTDKNSPSWVFSLSLCLEVINGGCDDSQRLRHFPCLLEYLAFG